MGKTSKDTPKAPQSVLELIGAASNSINTAIDKLIHKDKSQVEAALKEAKHSITVALERLRK